MDEQLIYLESDEEITAVIDRLRESDAGRIRFVIPKGALVLQSLVSLKLLKREAAHLAKMIAIVTLDPVGLRLGEQADISVYAKPKDPRPMFASSEAVPVHHATTPDQGELPETDEELETTEDEPVAEELPEESGILVHRYDGARAAAPREQASVRPVHQPAAQVIRRATHAKSPTRSLFRLVQWLLLIGLLLFAGYLAFTEMAPKAVVALGIATEPIEQSVTVVAATAQTEIDETTSRIPAQMVSHDVRVEKSVPATGKKQVGEKATTTLALYNYWDATPQVLPVGTKFRATDGTSFVSTAAATISGASTTLKEGKVTTTPGQTSVAIEAERAGPEANDKSGRMTIPSLATNRQDKIYGETTAATSGGTSREVTVVAQVDLDGLATQAKEALKNDAQAALATTSSAPRILEGAMEVRTTKEEFSAAVGTEAESVSVVMEGTVSALIVEDAALNQVAVSSLRRTIPSARTLIVQSSDTLVPTVKKLDMTTGELEIEAKMTSHTAVTLDTEQLRETIAGQSVLQAETTLRQTTGVVSVEITNRPRWLQKMPRHEAQIELRTNYIEQADAAETN